MNPYTDLEPSTMVKVHWTDSTTNAGWHKPSTAKLATCVSVGLVGETRDDCLVLVSGTLQGSLEGDVTAIPWGIIREIYTFEVEPAGGGEE